MPVYHILIAYPKEEANFNGDGYCATVFSKKYVEAVNLARRDMERANYWNTGAADELDVIMAVEGGVML